MAITINGNGTVAGISVGGLPDGIVDTDMLAAAAVTAPKRGAGAVLQVVDASTSDSYSNTSETYSDYTNGKIAITPQRSNSKLMIVFDIYQNVRDLDVAARGKIRIREVITGGATTTAYTPNINEGENFHSIILNTAGSGTTDLDFWYPATYCFTRTISSSSVHTYQFQGSTGQADDTYYRAYGTRMSIMEIAQ